MTDDLSLPCSVTETEILTVRGHDRGHTVLEVNDGDGVCLSEIILSRYYAEQLRDWLNEYL